MRRQGILLIGISEGGSGGGVRQYSEIGDYNVPYLQKDVRPHIGGPGRKPNPQRNDGKTTENKR